MVAGALCFSAHGQKPKPLPIVGAVCPSVSFEGEVAAGQAFRRVFTPGLELFIEPLRSGWIIRVLALQGSREIRGPHDYAEVATPPFRSPNPLVISTDWAFRAQDAAAWNPREFRYAGSEADFRRLGNDADRLKAGDRSAEVETAGMVPTEPEGILRLMDVALVPGSADQWRMAAAVASHLDDTPHEVVQGRGATKLGILMRIKFRVKLDLPAGAIAGPGLKVQQESCSLRPTA